jgi:hypothetical protein
MRCVYRAGLTPSGVAASLAGRQKSVLQTAFFLAGVFGIMTDWTGGAPRCSSLVKAQSLGDDVLDDGSITGPSGRGEEAAACPRQSRPAR